MGQGTPGRQSGWPLLILALAVAGAVSLTIHVVMIEALGVAYPDDGATPAWPRLISMAASVAGLLFAYDLARPSLERFGPWLRWLILFAAFVMVKETLRGLVMNGVVSTAWAWSVIDAVPALALMLVIAGLVVLSAPWLKTWPVRLCAGMVLGAVCFFAIQPAIGAVTGPWIKSLAYLNHADLYQLPYPLVVMVPAYLTYIEPVAGCTLIAALTWPRLSRRPALRIAEFTLLILLIKGVLARILLFSPFIKAPLGQAILSESQFTFEWLALAVSIGLIWDGWTRRRG